MPLAIVKRQNRRSSYGSEEIMSLPLDEYYEILELNQDVSGEEIKRAYRRLALKYHPDKNLGNEEWASKIFTKINEAYSILIDSAHIGEVFETVEDAKAYFKRNFYDLVRRIDSDDFISDKICQEECDYFFRYQLGEVSCVKRSIIEARRIIDLMKKASSKGYDVSGIMQEYSDFFQKFGFDDDPKYNGYKDLIAEYKRIIEDDPSNAFAHYALGFIYEKRNMINEAISEYRLATNIDPYHNKAKRAYERLLSQQT
jgi:curved DNA-binding protein CbpA